MLFPFTIDPLEVDMTAKVVKTPRSGNPHVEAAQRIRQLAQILANDPSEAKALRAKTGMFTSKGELKANFR